MKLSLQLCIAIMTLALVACKDKQTNQQTQSQSVASSLTTVLIKPQLANQSGLWQADLGNGLYQNPILHADYSDPDVVAVGDDFYMTASSFNSAPGLPILHSNDLVNWKLLGYAVENLIPKKVFSVPQHGNGIWAPCIRYHDGKVWIFYPDPDFGIYMIQSSDPKKGQWTTPKLILPGKGIIDPTPLWDDDGKAYLLHGWAKSRSGKNNILTLRTMSADGTKVSSQGKVIIDGHKLPGYHTLEGPKFYQRNGYYYVFAPAGGVPVGWQAVFRSKNIEGPYESYTSIEQGDTLINGPHQGAWVRTNSGEDWFFHFQSSLAYGRMVHLQPMQWLNDWPVIGDDSDSDGVGNPVRTYRKPNVGKSYLILSLANSDEFEQTSLALQWQWNANSDNSWYSLTERPGFLRLFAKENPNTDKANLWLQPSLLLQKIPAPRFIVETTINIPKTARNISAGLTIFGEDYSWIGVQHDEKTVKLILGHANCYSARKGCQEKFWPEVELEYSSVTLRMTMIDGGGTIFSYLDKSGRFKAVGEMFQAKPGRWVGAKIGLFSRFNGTNTDGTKAVSGDNYIDIDSIVFTQPREIQIN